MVNGVTNPTFSYDNNGNLTSGVGRSVTWTSFNQVATVTQGLLALSYTYDAEHQRIKQSDGTNITYYLNDPLTGVGSEYSTVAGGTNGDYLFADGERIGVRTKTNAPSTTALQGFVQDHASSVAVVTNSAGAVVQRLAYDAWGRRRNPNGSDDPSGTITAPTSRGYTDHEHLPGISLINMNARIYDPEIGWFMSADTIIPNPFMSQSLNRYSYVDNNPVSMIDPTGHDREIPEIVATGRRLTQWGTSLGIGSESGLGSGSWTSFEGGGATGESSARGQGSVLKTNGNPAGTGVASTTENYAGGVIFRVVTVIGTRTGGTKFNSWSRTSARSYAQEGGKGPYTKDRTNKGLRSKIHVGDDGTITTDRITVSFEGIDEATAKAYIATAEGGWRSISLDLDLVASGGDLRIVPCTSVCSVNPADGGFLGAALVGGRVIYYGASQYVDTPVHEFGHILGLSHTGTKPGSIMGGYEPRSVNADDLSRVRSLYE